MRSRQPDHDFTLNSILPESKSSMDLKALGERMCRSNDDPHPESKWIRGAQEVQSSHQGSKNVEAPVG